MHELYMNILKQLYLCLLDIHHSDEGKALKVDNSSTKCLEKWLSTLKVDAN